MKKKRYSQKRSGGYYLRNKLKILADSANRRAKRLGVSGRITAADLAWVTVRDRNRCRCCGKNLSHVTGCFDHMIRLGWGPNNRNNIQLLCRSCHGWKRSLSIDFTIAAMPVQFVLFGL